MFGLLSSLFFFLLFFGKKNFETFSNVFFKRGVVVSVQITCAISLHLRARFIEQHFTREREGKMSSTSASSEESAGNDGGRGRYGANNISSPASATPYYSHQSHILQHQVGVDFLSSFQLQQTQTQQNPAQQTRGEQPSTKLSSPSSLSLSGGGSGQQHAQSSSSPQLQQQQQQKATTTTTTQQQS